MVVIHLVASIATTFETNLLFYPIIIALVQKE